MGSRPAEASAATSRTEIPSIHSLVRTDAEVRVQSICGTRNSASPRVRSYGSDAAAASMRRSSSSATLSARVAASARKAWTARFTEDRSGHAREKRQRFQVAVNCSRTLGRRIFAATRTGGSSLVWSAMHLGDGRAASAVPKLENSASTGLPNARTISARAWASEKAAGDPEDFQRARDLHADNVGPRRQHLSPA